MRIFGLGRISAACLLFVSIGWLPGVSQAQVSVTTYHNDNARTGQNTQETILTPSNVNSQNFGKLFALTLDGTVYAQPLILANLSIGGSTHNVAYVATEHDSVYAIDADNGTIYAQTSLIPSGGSTVSSANDLGCGDLIPEIGITGTPVIDPNTKTLYVVANSKTSGGTLVQYLHALDVTTLAEKFGGPVQIVASAAGNAYDGNGSTVPFSPKFEFQRPALLLENGHVVIGWGGHCDATPWHGWVMSYSASTLAQEAVFNVTPNGAGGAVWMSGGGLAADSSGNIYFTTGNGDFDGSSNFGDSIVKLAPPANGKFTVSDYFTPWNQATLYTQDQDVSGGGLLLLPALPSGAPLSGSQLIPQQGKFGTLVLVNSGNLGKYCPNASNPCTSSDPNAVQEITKAGGGVWGSPAYWNGNVYLSPAGSGIRAYSFNANNSGVLSSTPTSQSAQSFGYAAPTPSVSSNGSSNGILWALSGAGYKSTCGSGNCLGLFAYDATNLSNLLYSSSQTSTDSPGTPVKYAVPVIANGKVYIGTQTGLGVYGLRASAATASPPTFSLPVGTYNAAQSLTLSDSTPGATIYYTLDGSTPTTGSSKYSSALTIGASMTVQAIAVASGYTNSTVASATYIINTSGGTGPAGTDVNLSSQDNLYGITNNGSAVPGVGLDGSGYTYSANLLGSSLAWSGSTFTFGSAGAYDAMTSKTVTLPAGSYTTLNLLAAASNGNQTNQSFVVNYTDGSSSTFTQSISDWLNPQGYAGESIVSTMAYRLAINGSSSPGPVYLFGYSFTLNSAKTVASLTLPNNINVFVLAIDLTSASTATPTAATPTISPNAGSFGTSTVTVSMADSTTGASIYYTLDGTTPTGNSAPYYSPLTLSESTTVQAIAVANGYKNSAVGSATYVVNTSGSSGSAGTVVNLSSQDNLYGITSPGTAVPGPGLDGSGYTYSANLLGGSLAWSGSTFKLGTVGALDAITSKTITLPAGNYTTLNLIGSGVSGNQPNQSFVVTYSDGTSSTFTQSLSDWLNPQGYAGESVVAITGYRVSITGSTSPGPVYLYGYSFALNSAKTVASLTLPNDANVVVLAIDLTPAPVAPLTTATPTFSLKAGSYSGAQTLTLADATSGATIYYTLDGTTPTASSATYAGSISLSESTTVRAIAVASGYTNSAIASATYIVNTTTGSGSAGTAVSLSGADSVYGIAANGSAVANGGIDGAGYAYSANLLGSSIVWAGSTFTLGAAGSANAVSSQTISVPAGYYSTLNLLGSGVSGNQPNQTFIVNYSDGTSSTFTQSLSDWFNPQGYTGETVVSTMGYRVSITGATSPGPVYLYGYSFALNTAKSVVSLTLPNNSDVVVLAIDLTPTAAPTPTAATPQPSLATGTYTGTQTVTLSDATAGATIYYTTNGSTPTTSSSKYSGALTINATTTVKAIAVASGYNNSAVASATYTIGAAGSGVSLTSEDNLYGITNDGTAVPGPGLDGSGYTYSAKLLGSSISWSGSTFTFGAAGGLDAVSSQTIALPAGNYSTLSLLGAGVNGNQTNQTFIVNYSDGTSSTFTQSLSDWFNPQGYTGESIVSTMAYRISITGATSPGPVYLYGYSFALNGAKSVVSLTLPSNSNVVVLAVDLTPSSSTGTPTVATPQLSLPTGSYAGTQSVTLSDLTAGATIYYTTNGTTPTTNSSKYSGALTINATTTVEAIAVASGYNNSAVASATYTIGAAGSGVSLTSEDDLYGITNDGTAVPGPGLDGSGYTYSAKLLGSSISWSGSTFTFGAAGGLDAVTSQTIALPAGNYSTLYLLGSGVSGNQTNQTFIVNYSDGTSSTFTQSLSDWFNPQGYPGESIVSTMAYRISITGATSPGPVYLYGYSFALNSAKSVVSLTLPNNSDVVVLAVDLTPSSSTGTPTVATPQLSLPTGSYAGTQSVTLSDLTAGATIYYTTNGSTPTTSSSKYSGALTISNTTTVEAIAVASGYNNSAVASATYTIGAAGSGVSLTSEDDLYGITNDGTAVPGPGLDGSGYTYSAKLLGSSISWSGSTFTFGAAGGLDAVSSQTIALPAGNYSTLSLLGTGVNGNQTNQTFIVNYSDGTSSTFTQSLSDWFNPQGYTGESIVSTMAYRISITGATSPGPVYLYGYSFALNGAKSVVSLTLPSNSNVVVLAVDLTNSTQTAMPSFNPGGGTSTASSVIVTLSDTTPGAVIYYTTNGSTPTTSSTRYSAPLTLTSSATVQAIATATGYSTSAMASAVYTLAAAQPTFGTAPGSYSTPTVTVSLADSTPGAVIYYTLNGTTPTTSSSKYSGALTISATTTIQAIAVASGYANSAVASGTYTLGAASPTFTPTPGSYSTATVSVTLADSTPGAVIYYTTNGTTPTTSSSKYSSSLTISATTTFQAIAVAAGYANSQVSSATYTLGAAAPTFSPAAGNYSTSTVSVTLADSTPGATIYYTTNGTTPTTASPKYSSALTLSANTTIEAIAVASGYTNSGVSSATYGVTAPSPSFGEAAGNYTSPQTVSLSDTIPGATIYYTTNNTTPTTSSTRYTAPLTINATTTVQAIAVASGYNNSAVASATYTISAPAPVSVSLANAANVYGIVNNGSKVPGTGIDLHEYAYSAQLLGSTLSWSGSTFNFGAAGALDAVENKTVSLPAGKYSALKMLATAVNADKLNQPFIVTYSDGSTTTFTQSLSDWCPLTPTTYAGQSVVATMAYRDTPTGGEQTDSCYLYGYSFALNNAKTLTGITLPSNINNVVVLAIDLVP